MMKTLDKQYQANRLAVHVRLSAILWLMLSTLQLITSELQIINICLIIASIWNLFWAIASFLCAEKIINRDVYVLERYEGLSGYIFLGLIVNLYLGGLGGIIGCFFATYDYWIRSKIMSCRDIFDNTDGIVDNDILKLNSSSNYEQLEKPYELKQKGVLSDEEYEQEKAHLL